MGQIKSIFNGLIFTCISLLVFLCFDFDGQAQNNSSQEFVSNFYVQDIISLDNRLLAAGEHGQIIYSDNQGVTWKPAQTASNTTITALYFKDKTAWAIGHGPSILRSIDLGQTWKKIDYNFENSDPLFDVWFHDQNVGVIVGAYGLILLTKDGGKNWSKVNINSDPHFYSLTFTSNNLLFAAGEYGSLYRSENFGESWSKVDSPYTGSFQSLLNISDWELLLFGSQGEVFCYNYLKGTWQQTQSPIKTPIYSAVLIDHYLIAGSMEGMMLISSDLGKTFKLLRLEKYKSISVIKALEHGVLLLGDMNGIGKINIKRNILSSR